MKSEDIARLAGVSRSTVSRVINNYSNVPAKTREKVLKVIEEYNYEPNTSARILAGKANNTIGLFVISTAENDGPSKIYQSTYYSTFINTVVDAANTSDYYVLVHTIYSAKDYSKILQSFMQKRISGGILVGNEKDIGIIKQITRMGYPIGIVDYDIEEIERNKLDASRLTVVNSSDFDGTVEALNYLIHLGHRDIGIITGRMGTYSGRERYRAYEYTLKENGIELKPELVLKGEFLKKNAYGEVTKLIASEKLPTALFACNDDMAIAAMEVFMDKGIMVPADISVIGFDDIPIASHIKPALSTVRVPVSEMVTQVTEALINNIENGVNTFSSYTHSTKFIARDTCAVKGTV